MLAMSNTVKKSGRNYGLDLLRCFAMAMILMLHTLSRSGLLDLGPGSAKYEIVWFMEIFSYCAVNCFVLLSGYVSLHSKFRLSRIVLLWLQVLFYNVGLIVLVQAVKGEWDVMQILRAFLPVSSDGYWFFTQYFVLSFFMPFINKLVQTLTLRQNGYLVGVMLIFFSVLPMLYAMPIDILGEFNENLFLTGRGYSVLWMTVIYTCGAVLRRFLDENKFPKLHALVWLGMTLLSDIAIWVIHYLCVHASKKASPYFVVAYTSPLVVIATIGLVMFFSKLKFGKATNKLIAFFSSGAFAVYLVHSNSAIYDIFQKQVSPIADMRIIKMLPALLITIVFVFLVCTVFDSIRAKLFKLIGINKLCGSLDKLIK